MAENRNVGQPLRPASGGCMLIDIAAEISRLKSKLDAAGADPAAVSQVKV